MKKVSHDAPKVKAIHKDDATSDTHIQAEMTALDMREVLSELLEEHIMLKKSLGET